MFQTKFVEEIKHILYLVMFSQSHAVYEIIWENMVDPENIAKGNKAYYANSKVIKSKLLKKNTKIKIYKTTIRPFVTY
jgi:UDP-glucose 4-epimerase